MTTLGVRNNGYSTPLGQIKYFDNKMEFRDIHYTMFDDKNIEVLTAKKKKVSKDNSVIQKLEAYLKN